MLRDWIPKSVSVSEASFIKREFIGFILDSKSILQFLFRNQKKTSVFLWTFWKPKQNMETKENNSKPTTPLHGNHNHHHEVHDVIKVSIYANISKTFIFVCFLKLTGAVLYSLKNGYFMLTARCFLSSFIILYQKLFMKIFHLLVFFPLFRKHVELVSVSYFCFWMFPFVSVTSWEFSLKWQSNYYYNDIIDTCIWCNWVDEKWNGGEAPRCSLIFHHLNVNVWKWMNAWRYIASHEHWKRFVEQNRE